jgi:hypothetical protein
MKKQSSRSDDFFDDFLDWMDSPEGTQSTEILYYVSDVLEGARVNPTERKIIWPDGESMSIEQGVERIKKDSGFDGIEVLVHVIGWLQMGYTPEGLNEKQMEQFENQIECWVEHYENGDLPASNL